MPNCKKDENLRPLQIDRNIYFYTIKNIPAGSELLVWYGDEYAMNLGVDEYSCWHDMYHIKDANLTIAE